MSGRGGTGRKVEAKALRAEPLPTRTHPGSGAPASAEQIWARLREALPGPPDRWERDRLAADTALRALLDRGPSAAMALARRRAGSTT